MPVYVGLVGHNIKIFSYCGSPFKMFEGYSTTRDRPLTQKCPIRVTVIGFWPSM